MRTTPSQREPGLGQHGPERFPQAAGVPGQAARQRGDDGEAPVHVHGQPAEPVPFPVHQPVRGRAVGEPQQLARRERAPGVATEELAVDGAHLVSASPSGGPQIRTSPFSGSATPIPSVSAARRQQAQRPPRLDAGGRCIGGVLPGVFSFAGGCDQLAADQVGQGSCGCAAASRSAPVAVMVTP